MKDTKHTVSIRETDDETQSCETCKHLKIVPENLVTNDYATCGLRQSGWVEVYETHEFMCDLWVERDDVSPA